MNWKPGTAGPSASAGHTHHSPDPKPDGSLALMFVFLTPVFGSAVILNMFPFSLEIMGKDI